MSKFQYISMINLEKQIQKICVATNGVTTLKLLARVEVEEI